MNLSILNNETNRIKSLDCVSLTHSSRSKMRCELEARADHSRAVWAGMGYQAEQISAWSTDRLINKTDANIGSTVPDEHCHRT